MKKYTKIITYSILILAGIIAYGNVLNNDLVYDDASVIKDNKHLKNISNITDIFSKNDYFERSGIGKYRRYGESTYRPMVTISYFIDFALFGESAKGSHAMNLIYHLIQVILIYKLIFLISKNQKLSFLTSLLFSAHPAASEAVNAISFREDILCAIFFTLSFLYYIQYLGNHLKNRSVVLSAVFYFLSCLSKENGFILPAIIFCFNHIIYYPSNKSRVKNTSSRLKIVYFLFTAAGIAFLILRFIVFNFKSPDDTTDTVKIIIDLTRFLNLIPFYVKQIAIPYRLSPAYNTNFLESFGYLMFSIPFISSILYLAYINRKKNPIIPFGILWFIITLLPVSGLIYLQHPIAERYLYLPMIGVILLFAQFLLIMIRNPKVSAAVFVFIFLLLSSITARQNTVWKSEFSLWDYTVKLAPNNYNALANYAVVLSDSGKLQESILYYDKALKIDNRAQSHYNLANTYSRLGLREKAKESYLTSIKLDPNYSEAHNNLAKMYGEEGMYIEAIDQIKIALSLNPYNPQAFNNLGVCYNQLKRYNEAIEVLKKAAQLQPRYTNAYFNLSSSYYSIGNYEEAEKLIRMVIALEPNNNAANDFLQTILSASTTLNKQNNADENLNRQTNNSQIKTQQLPHPEMYKNRDIAIQTPLNITQNSSAQNINLIQSRGYTKGDLTKLTLKADQFMAQLNYVKALEMYRKAIKISPDDPNINFKLSDCYMKLGSFKLAKRYLLNVLRLSPNYPDASNRISYIDRILRQGKSN